MPTQERTSPCFVSVEDLNRESAPGYRPSPEVIHAPNGTRVVVDENFDANTILPDGTIIRNRSDTGTPLPPFMENGEQPNPQDEGSAEVHALPRRPRGMFGQQAEPEVGIIVETTENDAFENLILFPEVTNDIKDGLRQISMRDQLEAVWGISRIYPVSGRVVISMYGPSGCGKTRACRAAARMLGKKMYQVDYAQVVSKYLGDTAKHIKQAFTRAKQLDAVLFWDEADSLMSRRVDMGESCATSINQNRNTLMQELDRFPNPVFMTTNLFGNYDEAFIRRIAKHIEFKLPNKEMRKEIFKKHIPNMDLVDADLDLVAAASDTLAGGDISNICLNVILASSVDADTNNWRMKQETFLAEIQKVKNARTANATSRASRVARPAAPAGT
jgi:ABC-type dipeptide/oligopeptide/nickel transport system ATPase subunit